MKLENYYEIFGIDPNATQEEIKKAYRKLAFSYHSDTNKDVTIEENLLFNKAFEILRDDEKRAKYDAQLNIKGSGFGSSSTQEKDLFSDIFSTSGAPQPEVGETKRKNVVISLKESLEGVSTEISVDYEDECLPCNGSGYIIVMGDNTCVTCGGTKKLITTTSNDFGHTASTTRVCPDCKGKGGMTKEECKDCKGLGHTIRTEPLRIKIPPGAKNNQVVTLKGYGGRGKNKGPNGPLKLTILVREEENITRVGDNILVDLKLLFTEFVLGTKKDIYVLGKDYTIEVPKFSKPGDNIVFKRKGATNATDYNIIGDLIICLELDMPSSTTKEQEELLTKLNL